MYVRLRKLAEGYPMFIPILLLLVCFAGVWFFADRRSNIDESGIQRSTVEINNARRYNQQAVDDNRRTRTAVERSEIINDRAADGINRSIEITERTKGAINRSEEYVNQARSNAITAKGLISESRSILEHADERTKESQSKVSQ